MDIKTWLKKDNLINKTVILPDESKFLLVSSHSIQSHSCKLNIINTLAFNQPANQPNNQVTNQPSDQATNPPTNHLTIYKPTHQPSNQPTHIASWVNHILKNLQKLWIERFNIFSEPAEFSLRNTCWTLVGSFSIQLIYLGSWAQNLGWI